MNRLILGMCLFLISFSTWAWGPSGQTITVALSEKYLTSEAKIQISKILKGQTLASVATWADSAKNGPEWARTASWHYIDRESAVSKNDSINEPADVRDAIALCQQKLESGISETEKLVWLKFLVHFIGDLHQPMHVGKPEDRGGNLTKVSYKGKNVNLHALWDSSFIEEQKLDVNSYVEKLIRQSRPRKALLETFSADAVIAENLSMRPFLYSFQRGTIDASYSVKALEATDERLWTGGIRLASVLNEIFK